MLPVSINHEDNSVNIPFGSKFTISYRSKANGVRKIARMKHGPKSGPDRKENHFIALFDEDDVDFQIEMGNSSGDRFVRFVARGEFAFVTIANSVWKIDRLASIGKFHFSTARRKSIEFDVNVECSKPPNYPVYVNIGRSKKATLEVNRLFTVAKLKEVIHSTYWIDLPYQILYLDGKPLDDVLTMEALDIREYSMLELKGVDVAVTFKILPNRPVTLDINALDTVAEIKIKIAKNIGIPVSGQHLYVDDNEIFDDEFLEHPTTFLYIATDCTDPKNECIIKNIPHECFPQSQFRVNVRKNGTVFPVNVCSMETVAELRWKIQQIEEDAPTRDDHPNCSLFHRGKRLRNDFTLEMYRIKDESNLELHVPCTNDRHVCIGKEIRIKTLSGKVIRISGCGLNTIGKVKCQLESTDGYPIDQQRFIFSGTRLENELTFNDYGICPDTTLDLVMMLKAGCACGCRSGSYDGCARYMVLHKGKAANTNFEELPSHNFRLDRSIKIQPFVVELRLAANSRTCNE